VKSFEVLQLSADDAPGPCFRGKLAEREERAPAVVKDEGELFAMAGTVVEKGAACCALANSFGRSALDGGEQRGEETFGQGIASEEKNGVGCVACERIPEKGDAGYVAGE
jgi:hypothetical protein